ncbi:hypothetical protein BKA61DRAFT_680273 [Leptodontidium sp. MPI-SDFR-AT-0119]|nr:hypothetical protein BKA61DRAFT_680273 [Leptodontidium sp. MPI-SDFR-AT-0119]
MSTRTITREEAIRLTKEFFADVDALRVEETGSYYDEDALCQFGNQPIVQGKNEIKKLLADWYDLFDSMYHDNQTLNLDAEENTIITSQLVEYVIKAHGDKNPVVIPSMSYMKLAPSCSGGKWKFIDFRVYFDTSPIFKKVMTTSS